VHKVKAAAAGTTPLSASNKNDLRQKMKGFKLPNYLSLNKHLQSRSPTGDFFLSTFFF